MDTKMIPILIVALLTLRAGFLSKKSRNKFIELLGNGRWKVNILIVIGFIIYIVYETKNDESKDGRKVKEALKKAIVAFVIALLAELGLTIAPFWLVFVLVYYMDGWI